MTTDRIIWCRDCQRFAEARELTRDGQSRDVVGLHGTGRDLCPGAARSWAAVLELATDWRESWIPARSQPASERLPQPAPMSPPPATRGPS